MKSRHIFYYLLAFLLALGLRFIGLGTVPLTDKEAELALQALAIAKGENPLLSGQPGYILLTSIPFYLFDSTNFLARFFPALAGSLLVFAPYFLREKLGERAATLAAFLLAAAPGLVAVSRQANGTMLAVTFGIFAWAMWWNNRPQLAGIFAGIALLGGASVWLGLLIASLTWALAQNLLPESKTEIPEASETEERSRADDFKVTAKFTSGTLLLVGTLFFLSPNGLSAFFTSFVEFLRGWRYASGIPFTHIFGGLLAYYPLALLFGIIAMLPGILKIDRTNLVLSLWALIALLIITFYPSHQTSDLIWVGLPLWVLSAHEINRHLHMPIYDRNETFGVFALTVLLLSFGWLNISGASAVTTIGAIPVERLILLGGSLILLILSLGLIAVGWSLETAVLGGTWGAAFMLGLYTLSAAWGSSGLRTPKGIELWDNAPRVTQAGFLLETVDSVLNRAQQTAKTPKITVYGVDSSALLWTLRNHDVDVVTALDLSSPPELVITPQNEQVELASTYRGQDFIWRQVPDWTVAIPVRWLVLREIPMQSEKIILWGRNDLFFDSQN